MVVFFFFFFVFKASGGGDVSLLFTPCAPGAQPAALLAALGSGMPLPCFPPLPSNICRVWKEKKNT